MWLRPLSSAGSYALDFSPQDRMPYIKVHRIVCFGPYFTGSYALEHSTWLTGSDSVGSYTPCFIHMFVYITSASTESVAIWLVWSYILKLFSPGLVQLCTLTSSLWHICCGHWLITHWGMIEMHLGTVIRTKQKITKVISTCISTYQGAHIIRGPCHGRLDMLRSSSYSQRGILHPILCLRVLY